jgi:TRAP-type C4-dicarboxylate transport system substrate-binding protein
MAKDAATRAPRGTKVLAQAFFSAADGIPDDRRDAVVKAALALIREQLKEVRDRAKVAKEKMKAKGAKAPAARKVPGRRKAAAKKAGRRVGPAATPTEAETAAEMMDGIGGGF